MTNTLSWVHELLCAIMFWSVFCRSTKADKRVRLAIRLAFLALGAATCMGMAAPFAWGYVPHPVAIVMLAAFTLVQVVTAVLWTDGPPTPFVKPRYRMRRRRSTDTPPAFHSTLPQP